MTLASVICAGVLLIPYLRYQPYGIHEFAHKLPDWQRRVFVFSISLVFSYVLIKLLSPNLPQLHLSLTHPPAWSAWIVAQLSLGVLDLHWGLSTGVYSASLSDWIGYAFAPVITAFAIRHIQRTADARSTISSTKERQTEPPKTNDIEELEIWLRADSPAAKDRFGRRSVAKRVAGLLDDGVNSIGIVAPYGAGKSTISKWTIDLLRNSSLRYFISEHSCWGFDNSQTSIHTMLSDALSTIAETVDILTVSSLPASYRRAFGDGDTWIDRAMNYLIEKRDPIEQFLQLSRLLQQLDARLVFFVDDLDRNDSKSFDLQEVLAFLQQLKTVDRIAFVLTGGISPSARIDFARLCDHIEFLRTISADDVTSAIEELITYCHRSELFPHTSLSARKDSQLAPNPFRGLWDGEYVWIGDAVSQLLSTPRILRHALGATYQGWRHLFGEVDFDSFLLLGVLRTAAPEALTFVMRHLHQFRRLPADNSLGAAHLEKVRSSISGDWKNVIEDVEWDPKAALALITFLLPLSRQWFERTGMGGTTRVQGVHEDRYWQRALSLHIPEDEIRDQTIIRDIQGWHAAPSKESPMIVGICSSEHYSIPWQDIVVLFINEENALRLCEHVLGRIREFSGSAASRQSQGFAAILRYARRVVTPGPPSRVWLQAQIAESAPVSLELVNSLWSYWGKDHEGILNNEDRESAHASMVTTLREKITTAKILEGSLHPDFPHVLYQLVFNIGRGASLPVLLESWQWLAPVILDGLEQRNFQTVIATCSLITDVESSMQSRPQKADIKVLRTLFGTDAMRAINAIEISVSHMGERDRLQVDELVASAKAGLT